MGRLKKAEYIAKFGEDAWKEYLEKARVQNNKQYYRNREKHLEYQRKYYETHKEEVLERGKEYHQINKEKRNEYSRIYRETNKELLAQKRKEEYYSNIEIHKERDRVYRKNNKEKRSEYQKQYYLDNKEEIKKYAVNYRRTKQGRAKDIIHAYAATDFEKNRGACTLTEQWIIDNIFNSKCIYCGDDNWRHLGCDRIDNDRPHAEDNCVCACGICNIERANRKMSVEEFVEYRKTHPRDVDFKPPQKVVEINGKKVIKKVG